ncbi:MAG: FixH family protein [Syntrophales bacterium]
MKKMVLAVLMVLLIAGTAVAKNYEVTKKAGDYSVVVSIDKNPPTTGDNNLSVSAKDGAGADVTDAKVVVEYSMPAMPGMPAMNYKTNAEWTGKEYKSKINFSMSGSWNMAIKILRAGKTTQVKFTVDAR